MTELSDHNPMATPEYFAACRQGKEAEAQVLYQFLQRVEQEGDAEDKYLALYRLFEMYVSHLDHDNALRILDEMNALPSPLPYLTYLIAKYLFEELGESNMALNYTQRGCDNLAIDYRVTDDYRQLLALKRLEFAILSRLDPESDRLKLILGELRLLMANQSVWDEYFVDALLTIGRLGIIDIDHRVIVEMTWADLVRREKFHGWSKAREIDDLAQLVLSIPLKDIDATDASD